MNLVLWFKNKASKCRLKENYNVRKNIDYIGNVKIKKSTKNAKKYRIQF